MDSIQNRTGQRLGGFAMAQGQGLAGQWSNLMSAPDTLLQNLFLRSQGGAGSTGGLQTFTSFLREVNGLLDPATERGGRFMNVMERLIDGVFGTLFSPGTGTSMVDTLLTTMEQAVPVVLSLARTFRAVAGPAVEGFIAAVRPLMSVLVTMGTDQRGLALWAKFGQILGFLAGAFVTVIGLAVVGFADVVVIFWNGLEGIYNFFAAIGSGIAGAGRAFWNWLTGIGRTISTFISGIDFMALGRSIAQGLANGISAGASLVVQSITGAGGAAIDAVTSQFGIHSPSRVMYGLGAYVSEGFSDGIESGYGGAASALAGLVTGPGGMATASSLARGAGALSGASISVEVHVNSSASDPEAVAREVARVFPIELAKALEEIALESGVMP